MSTHINKNKKKKPTPQNRAVAAQPDGMPAEVALELLCKPGARLTNRMRKNCNAARIETVFCSTLEPKTLPDFLSAHLKHSTAAQLAKWAKRTFVRRKSLEHRAVTVSARMLNTDENKEPLTYLALKLMLQQLGAQAGSADVFMAALAAEAKRRLGKKEVAI